MIDPLPLARLWVPCRTISESNARGASIAKAARVKSQREAAFLCVLSERAALSTATLPLSVILVRCAPRELDTDNLASALKAVRDGVTDGLQRVLAVPPRDDRDRLGWHCGQRPAPVLGEGVEVRVYPRGAALDALIPALSPDERTGSPRALPSDGDSVPDPLVPPLEALRWLAARAEALDALLVAQTADSPTRRRSTP